MTGLCLVAGYALIGSSWLILKTDGALQRRAVRWARTALWGAGVGVVAVSVGSPLVSDRIFDNWFSFPEVVLLAPLPVMTAVLFLVLHVALKHLPDSRDRWSWLPFAGTIGIFALCFNGLAYSFYPYVVPERLTIWEAASAPESLMLILIGTLFVLPTIIAYSAFAYYVFRGKATDLRYD